MNILGISCYYHDASAAILRDGQLLAAAEEERFTRKKHDNGFPLQAILYCLEAAGVPVANIDCVAFYEKPLLKFERVMAQHVMGFPRSYKTFLQALPGWVNEKLRVRRALRKLVGYRGDVIFVDHHMAHAASSFFVSPFARAAILTIDGVGEWTTTAYGVGDGAAIELTHELRFPHSLGLLYSTITAYLGFSVNNSEYKVMGLAPCGTMDRATNPYYDALRQAIDIKADGSLCLDLDYFLFHYTDRMPSARLCALLGGPVAPRDAEMTPRHRDIAAAVQLVTEDVMTAMLCHLHAQTQCDQVVLAGGVALNSVYNGKILRNTPFKQIWIQPNASDGGTSLGAALYAQHVVHGAPRSCTQQHAYWGPGYRDAEIEQFLQAHGVRYTRFANEDELIRTTAELLHQGEVIGWMQGRMEWGPRALGARSILANPCRPEMQAVLNEKVKHRERFRPFAPVVCAEDALTYFECDDPVPEPTDYMLMVYPVRAAFRDRIPAVTHVDGSGRLQTVRRHQHPRYYDLIKQFGTLSGIPMLVNTSFNIRGEPIVCTPFDAYKCMMGTGIDALVMGTCYIRRADNPQHLWDSETIAKD